MFTKINSLINKLYEGGGVSVELTEIPNCCKGSQQEFEEDEDEEEELEEGLFSKKVDHGKVVRVRNKLGDVEKVSNLSNRANLIKARLKSRTPQANLSRKHSNLVRKRQVDGER